MTEVLKPQTTEQLLESIQWALASETPLEISAGASKRSFGSPGGATHRLDLTGLSGIGLYEPDELVMGAAPATPMAEIRAALADNSQRLAFEPPDLGPLLGAPAASDTIGGVIACNLSGPRRIHAGAARDHLLGFRAVSGRGEEFKSGGRVVKNVTGFDLSKLMAGSFGTLGVMSEVTFKVVPAAEKTRTVLVLGASDEDAVRAMAAALASSNEVSAAAHLPAPTAAASGVPYVSGAGGAVTAVRVEGPGPSVDYRCRALKDLLADFGDVEELHTVHSKTLWREVRDVTYFTGDGENQVWRISVPPAAGARVAAEILATLPGRVFFDWGGGLVWLSLAPLNDAGHDCVRGALGVSGGHATLVRAGADVRARTPVFQPQPASLQALSARIKEAFDPGHILNPGRMGEGL
jgi:glycolate oxidase FAD binding subunit